MHSWVNGELADSVSIHDRSFCYGQGIFETILVRNSQPLLLQAHLQRLQHGAKCLLIPLELSLIESEIKSFCQQFCHLNEKQIVRVQVSMGVTEGKSGRGYANPQSPSANRIISHHYYPDYDEANWLNGIEVGVSSIALAEQPALAGIKHNNRLEQVLARAQWHQCWQEALLLDRHDNIIEATMSNLFMVRDQQLFTPDLSHCGVAGVMRAEVLDAAQQLSIKSTITSLSINELKQSDALFVTNSVIGIWPVRKLQDSSFDDFSTSLKLYKELKKNEAI